MRGRERRGSKEARQAEVTCENKCEDACTAALSFSPCTPPNTIEGRARCHAQQALHIHLRVLLP